MSITLNTQRDENGVILTNDDDERQGHITFIPDRFEAPWHVKIAGSDPDKNWRTLEAAEFYALALYADHIESMRR